MSPVNSMFDGMQDRRLPVYLLLDTSGSMSGVKIVEVNNGVQLIHQELLQDPRSANTVHMSIITFNDTAYQMPMTPITAFTPPTLVASGSTSLGAALHILNQSLDVDIIPNQPGRKGDYKPLVFLLTDGQPTDQWQSEAQHLASRPTNRALNTIGLAIGQDADVSVIKQICKVVLLMQNVTPDQLRAFFDWVSGSIKTASQAANAAGAGDAQVQFTAPPPGIVVDL